MTQQELETEIAGLKLKVDTMMQLLEAYKPLGGSTVILNALADLKAQTANRFDGLDNRFDGLDKSMAEVKGYLKRLLGEA